MSQSKSNDQTVKNQEEKQSQISIIQKYAIPYYLPTLYLLISGTLIYIFKTPFYSYAFALINQFFGKLLPKDDYEIKNSKYHNKYNYHAYPLVADVIGTWIFLIWCIVYIDLNQYTPGQLMQIATVIALSIAPSIDASHQLIHRPQKLFQKMGFLTMTIYMFNVYPTQHVYLHHKNVGTELDIVTSPKNQTFYVYIVKVFFSAYKFVYNHSKIIFIQCIAWIIIYLSAIFTYSYYQSKNIQQALSKLQFYVGTAMITYAIFEGVQYIEHYGLVFRNGQEKRDILQRSSWNTDLNQFTNWMVFRFQRHADHHLNAYKYYTTLVVNKKMAKLPITFFEAVLLSLIPPLYFYLMNPYVDQHMQNKKLPEGHQFNISMIRNLLLLVTLGLIYNAYPGLS